MALYGPLLDRYGRDKGQYKHKEYHVTPEGGLLTGPQLVLAYAERGTNCHKYIYICILVKQNRFWAFGGAPWRTEAREVAVVTA